MGPGNRLSSVPSKPSLFVAGAPLLQAPLLRTSLPSPCMCRRLGAFGHKPEQPEMNVLLDRMLLLVKQGGGVVVAEMSGLSKSVSHHLG